MNSLTRPLTVLMLLIPFVMLSGQNSTPRQPQTLPLYENGIPNLKNIPDGEVKTYSPEVDSLSSNVSRPTLSVFFPAENRKNRTAVIICPGGGYHTLLTVREGSKLAREFNRHGVVGIVLKYRHPNQANLTHKAIAPLQDAQQAVLTVREHASEWGIDPTQIGLMGFSAGGHVAATAGTRFKTPVIDNKKETSLRPDFLLLVYPVISCRPGITHEGSRNLLIGEKATEEQIRYFSNEEQVTPQTPPTFLILAGDDTVVPAENSLLFYNALRKNKVPAELYIYEKGEHGFLKEPAFDEWFGRCIGWMERSSRIKK